MVDEIILKAYENNKETEVAVITSMSFIFIYMTVSWFKENTYTRTVANYNNNKIIF